MDSRVDLTVNRDFRKRFTNDIPRSIFTKKPNVKLRIIPQPYITGQDFLGPLGGNAWYGLNSTTTSTGYYEYVYGETCDCCGKNITRLPWQQEQYGNLCRKCFKALESNHGGRIPW